MVKKMMVIAALALLTISCSITNSLSKKEPQIVVVTATPESLIPVDNAAGTVSNPTEYMERITDTISEPVSAALTLLAGPFADKLVRNDEYLVPDYCAEVNVKDFAARVTFTNLPAFDSGKNSFAFFFRDTGDDDQYRLIVYQNGWEFYNVRQTDHVLVNTGELVMTWDIHGNNTFEVYAVGDTGYFYLNGYRIFTLDLKGRDYPGDVCIVTSVYTNDTFGVVSEFEDFEVWELIPQ